MRLLRIDLLHCALIAILVLMVIYYFRSFREGHVNSQFVSYLSEVLRASPQYCYESKVLAPASEVKRTHESLDDFMRSGGVVGYLAGVSKESCPKRGFQQSRGAATGLNKGLEDAFTLLMKNAGIKGRYMTPMWMYVKT